MQTQIHTQGRMKFLGMLSKYFVNYGKLNTFTLLCCLGLVVFVSGFMLCCGTPMNRRLKDICEELLRLGSASNASINEINQCRDYMPDHGYNPCLPFECYDMPPCDFGYSVDELGCKICRCNTVYNGDIQLTMKSQDRLNRLLGTARNSAGGQKEQLLWDKNYDSVKGTYTIKFTLERSLEPSAVTAILSAMSEISSTTCISFRHLRSNDYHLAFTGGLGCFSKLGRSGEGDNQEIRIGSGCGTKGRVLHEIMHALGFWHEHTRPDRDEHIRIHWQNIQMDQLRNFLVRDQLEVDVSESTYDVTSVMQYDSYAFSKNGRPTMTDLSGNVISRQNEDLSEQDIKRINLLYKCPNH